MGGAETEEPMMAETELPIMCTLSPNKMVDRLTDFEALFAADLTALEREPLRLRLTFAGADAGRRQEILALFDAEQQCCAFLTFRYEQSGDGLGVEITAPAEAEGVLDGFQSLAERDTQSGTVR
jgi:hypothetical protein